MKNWRDQYPYDRNSTDWLTAAGRSGRLVNNINVPEDAPDVKPPRVGTRKDGDGPIIAVVQTESDEPVTRGRVIDEQGRR